MRKLMPLLGLALLSPVAADATTYSTYTPIPICTATLANCQSTTWAKTCHATFAQKCGEIFKANIDLTSVPSEPRILPPSNLGGFTSILSSGAFEIESSGATGTSTGLAPGSGVNLSSTVPTSAVPIATAHIQAVSQSRVKVADPTSYRSQRETWRRSVQVCQADPSAPFCSLINLTPFYRYESRHEIGSCVEYAWAKFADYSRWENKIAKLGEDYRAMVNAAFETGAVGALHLNEGGTETLSTCATVGPMSTYARDHLGTAYGFLYGRQPKNALIGNTAGIAFAINNGDFTSRLYDDQWAPAHAAWRDEGYNAQNPLLTWARHKYFLSFTAAQQTQIGGKTWNDVTLNYLYDLQKEFSVLARVAHQAAVAYRGTGHIEGGVYVPPKPVVPGLTGSLPAVPACVPVEDPSYTEDEAVARYYDPEVLAAKLKKYVDVFEQYGCFKTGTTPCDWSPKFFVEDLRIRVGALIEREYQSCIQRAPDPANFSDLALDPSDEIGSAAEGDQLDMNLSDYDWHIKPFLAQKGVPSVSIPIYQLRFLTTEQQSQLRAEVGSDTLTNANLPGYCTASAHNRYADNVAAFDNFVAAQPKMKIKRRICKIAAYAAKLLNDSESHLAGDDGSIYAPQFHHQQSHEEGGAVFGAGFRYETQFKLKNVGKVPIGSVLMFACPSAYFKTAMSGKATVMGQDATLLDVTAEQEGSNQQLSLNIFGEQVYPSGSQVQFSTVNAPGAELTETLADGYVSLLGIPIHYVAGYSGSAGVSVSRTGSPIACHTETLGGVYYGLVPNSGARDGLTVAPYVSVGAFLQAGVDAGVVSAGVRGQLTLVDISLPVAAEVAFAQQTEYPSLVSASTRTVTRATVKDSADLAINFLSGNIEAFAELDLGIASKSASATLASWDGLHQSMPLHAPEEYGFAFEDLRRYFDLLGGEPQQDE